MNRRIRNRTYGVWEDGSREAPSYPIRRLDRRSKARRLKPFLLRAFEVVIR